MKRVLAAVAVAVGTLAWAAVAPRQGRTTARFDSPQDNLDVLIDDVIPIVASGLPPGAIVAVRLHGAARAAPWTSAATFTADANGRIDLSRMAPVKGGYRGIDPMGLFWSAQRASGSGSSGADEGDAAASPGAWTLTATWPPGRP